MIRPRILPDNQDQFGFFEVVELDGALADPDHFCQCSAARFMTHVRTVGKVVGTKLASKQLVGKCRFVGRFARGVERGTVGRGERV